MSDILYEHPLNEKIRNYLKLEHLFSQAEKSLSLDIQVSYSTFFNSLFSILDILDRNDIRGELSKDLKKLEQNLVVWSSAPNVDSNVLQDNLRETTGLICQLQKDIPWQTLKTDRLLDSVRKRFSMQASCCCSDLPQLHYWLSQDNETIVENCRLWLSKLTIVESAIRLVLVFLRQRNDFATIQTPSGFYQDNGDGISLLRIRVSDSQHFYPTISGNKYRFSIRFAEPCVQSGQKYLSKPVSFELARC